MQNVHLGGKTTLNQKPNSLPTTYPASSEPRREPPIKLKENLTAAEAKALGNDSYAANHFQNAITYYTEAIRLAPKSHVLYSNRSAAYLACNQCKESLEDAQVCVLLSPDWAKVHMSTQVVDLQGYYRRGCAYLALGKYEEASDSFVQALQLESDSAEIQQKLIEASDALRMQKGQQLLLSPRDFSENKTVHTLQKYMKTLSDLSMPAKCFQLVKDSQRNQFYLDEIRHALSVMNTRQTIARVLDVGTILGLYSMIACNEGAECAVAVTPWKYIHSLTTKVLKANGMQDQVKSVHKSVAEMTISKKKRLSSPTKMEETADMQHKANILILSNIDDGLLGYGIITDIQQCKKLKLVTKSAKIIPSKAVVYAMGVEIRTGSICGLDVSGMNVYRWNAGYEKIDLNTVEYVPLTQDFKVFEFNMYDYMQSPTTEDMQESKTFELKILRPGVLNAIVFWSTLYGEATKNNVVNQLTTAPHNLNTKGLKQAVQFLEGEVSVNGCMLVNIKAMHNSRRIHFTLLETRYDTFFTKKFSVPKPIFARLQDRFLNTAYDAAIVETVSRMQNPVAMVVNHESGVLSMMASRAGCQKVIGVEMVRHLAETSKNVLFLNGYEKNVTVVNKEPIKLNLKDIGTRPNILIANIFEEGLLESRTLQILRHLHKDILGKDAVVIPAKAIVYAQAVQLQTGNVCGYDMSSLDVYRWKPHLQDIRLSETDFRPISEVFQVFHFEFSSQNWQPGLLSRKTTIESKLFKEATKRGSVCNAIVCWFDLHLTAKHVVSTSPYHSNQSITAWKQAVEFVAPVSITPNMTTLKVFASHDSSSLHFELDPHYYTYECNSNPPAKCDEVWLDEIKKMDRFTSFLFQTIEMEKHKHTELLDMMTILAAQSGSFGLDAETSNWIVNRMVHALHAT